jgi:hypothetical protein
MTITFHNLTACQAVIDLRYSYKMCLEKSVAGLWFLGLLNYLPLFGHWVFQHTLTLSLVNQHDRGIFTTMMDGSCLISFYRPGRVLDRWIPYNSWLMLQRELRGGLNVKFDGFCSLKIIFWEFTIYVMWFSGGVNMVTFGVKRTFAERIWSSTISRAFYYELWWEKTCNKSWPSPPLYILVSG